MLISIGVSLYSFYLRQIRECVLPITRTWITRESNKVLGNKGRRLRNKGRASEVNYNKPHQRRAPEKGGLTDCNGNNSEIIDIATWYIGLTFLDSVTLG